jgi:phosphoenolpyruvate synthase/pyruvate phosphate dikinase
MKVWCGKLDKYEVHEREYYVVSVSAGFHSFFRPCFTDFYGATLQENIILIKKSIFYHCQREGERMDVVRSLLQRVNDGKIDLEKEFELFETMVQEYLALLATDKEEYTKELFLRIVYYYQRMWNLAYGAVDSMDVIDILDEKKKEVYESWITKVRKLAEPLYKKCEVDFMPKYLQWFADNVVKGYTPEELRYLVFTEMESFIKDGKALPSKEELMNRKEYFFIRSSPGDVIEYCSGEEARKIIEEKGFFKEQDYSDVKEVSGKIAYAGRAEGKVCVVKTKEDMAKFSEGDVLVSVMTEPYYLPIIEKAVAIVTDEGGVLCHAAIVARELKIPTVIGTKIATKVFKDGDIVEVDATNGVVRKKE